MNRVSLIVNVGIAFGVAAAIGLSLLNESLKDARQENNTGPAKRSESINYNPDICRRDAAGNVYFAAGDFVFKLPVTEYLYTYGLDKVEPGSVPSHRDLSEQEGCPDNPIAGRAFSFYVDYKSDKLATTEREIKITIVRKKSSDPIYMKDIYAKSFDSLKRLHNNCVDIISGFTACSYPDKDKKFAGDMEISAYRADLSLYSFPFGEPMTISCAEPYAPLSRGRKCDAVYVVYKDVSGSSELVLEYTFYRKQVPPSEMIIFDRMVRERLAAMKIYN